MQLPCAAQEPRLGPRIRVYAAVYDYNYVEPMQLLGKDHFSRIVEEDGSPAKGSLASWACLQQSLS